MAITSNTKCWRYCAYNDQFKIVNGVAEASSFAELALHLRQNLFLCILSAKTIDVGTYKAECRLRQMRQMQQIQRPGG